MLQCSVAQPGREGRKIQRAGGTKAQIRLDLLEMGGPRLNPAAIGGEDVWWKSQLLGYKGDGRPRRRAEVIGGKAEVAQRTELERKAQLIVGTALLADFLGIRIG